MKVEFEVDHERDLPFGYFYFVRSQRFNASDNGEEKADALAAELNAREEGHRNLLAAIGCAIDELSGAHGHLKQDDEKIFNTLVYLRTAVQMRGAT